MNPTLKNVLAVVTGIVVGSAVNFGLILLGGTLIPPPEGVDVSSSDSLRDHMHLLEFRHFIFPFLAHALGTLTGAYLTAKLAVNSGFKLALVIGFFFLLGGIANLQMLAGTPTWFAVVDLVLAYLPMAWLGHRWAGRSSTGPPHPPGGGGF